MITTPIDSAITSMIPKLRTRFGVSFGIGIIADSESASLGSERNLFGSDSVYWSLSRLRLLDRKSEICSVGRNSMSAKLLSACKNALPLFGRLNFQSSMKTANWRMLTEFQRYFRLYEAASCKMNVVHVNTLMLVYVLLSRVFSSVYFYLVNYLSHLIYKMLSSGSIYPSIS